LKKCVINLSHVILRNVSLVKNTARWDIIITTGVKENNLMKYAVFLASALLLSSCAHHGRPHGQATIFFPADYSHGHEGGYYEKEGCRHHCGDTYNGNGKHHGKGKWKNKHHGGGHGKHH
jgi:hypothetical protein